jgi:hypothetical protein
MTYVTVIDITNKRTIKAIHPRLWIVIPCLVDDKWVTNIVGRTKDKVERFLGVFCFSKFRAFLKNSGTKLITKVNIYEPLEGDIRRRC